MRCFPALLLILALLSGCAAQASYDLAEASAAPESVCLYDPNSTLEAATHGALRCFPLEKDSCDGLYPTADGLFLFAAGEFTTTVSKLNSAEGLITASIELPFPIGPQDSSFHGFGNGFSCFDAIGRETIALDENLQIVLRIPAPKELTGIPLLSADGSVLYYCTATAIRGLDIPTGISRVLKEAAYPSQSVSGLHLNDAVLECTILNSAESSRLFLSTQNGDTLHVGENIQSLQTHSTYYYAGIQEGSRLAWVFGSTGEAAQTLLFPAADTTACILAQQHRAIGMRLHAAGKVTLDSVDLNTGHRTASLSFATETLPRSVVGLPDGTVWFLNYDKNYGCDTLYCWNTALSSVTDSANYTGLYFTRESPDDDRIAECIQLAQRMEAKYGIEVLVYQDAVNIQPEDYRLTYEYQAPVLMQELQQLEKYFQNYPTGFLSTIAQRFDGLTICIVRSFTPISGSASPESANGLPFWDGHHAYIALAAGSDTQRALYHQLCHLIDTIVLNACSKYDTWNQLNPTGFEYDYDYAANQSRNSTAYLLDTSRYFVDMYSMSFPKEDRARIMEYAMTPGNELLFQGDAMQAKLKTLCLGIREAFSLEDCPEAFLWEQYLQNSLAPTPNSQ